MYATDTTIKSSKIKGAYGELMHTVQYKKIIAAFEVSSDVYIIMHGAPDIFWTRRYIALFPGPLARAFVACSCWKVA